MRTRRPYTDDDHALVMPIYAPRNASAIFSVPASGILEGETYCLRINKLWLAHILGALAVLDQPGAWNGDVDFARDQVRKLMASIDPECPSVMGITNIRVNNCILEAEFSDNPGVWVTVGDLSACAIEGPQGPEGPAGADGEPGLDGYTPVPIWNGTQLAWDLDEDGTADTTPVDLRGPQGIDGICPDCGDGIVETPGEDGNDKRCNVASYLVDIVLPSLMEEMLSKREDATDVVDLFILFFQLGLTIFGGLNPPAWVIVTLFASEASRNLAGSFITANASDIRASLTPAFWEEVRCIIYDHLPDSGIITQDVRDAIEADIDEIPTGNDAGELVTDVIQSVTREAIDHWVLLGTAYTGGDCSICGPEVIGWSYEWDFTISDGGWVKRPGYNLGIYIQGEGWKPGSFNNAGTSIQKNFGSTITWTRTDIYTNQPQQFYLIFSPTFDNHSAYFGQQIYSNQWLSFINHTHTITTYGTGIGCSSNINSRITKVVIHGDGPAPTTLTGGTLTEITA